jgi:hypothetical protein
MSQNQASVAVIGSQPTWLQPSLPTASSLTPFLQVWRAAPDGAIQFNQQWLDYTGLLSSRSEAWPHDGGTTATEIYVSDSRSSCRRYPPLPVSCPVSC